MGAMDTIRAKFDRLRPSQGGWIASCPAHEDRSPSLSIAETNGKVLIKCHAGCENQDVLAALGLGWEALFDEPLAEDARPEKVTEYVYQMPDGTPYMIVERWREPGGKKSFRQRMAGSERYGIGSNKPALYRLPRVLTQAGAGGEIWLCYSDDTEVLTPEGWVFFSDLQDGQRVAQYRQETGSIEFVEPLDRQVFDYTGEMVHLKAKWSNLLVTPDHRVLTKWKTSAPRVIPADRLGAQRWLPVSGVLSGTSGPSVVQARLLAAWQADGGDASRSYRIAWNVKKARKVERLRKLFADNGVQWQEQQFASTPGWTYLTVDRRDVPWLADYLPGKRYHAGMLSWSLEARQAILEELGQWDGDFVGARGIRLFVNGRDQADAISAMAVTSGFSSIIRHDTRPDRPQDSQENYVINLGKRDWRNLGSTPERVDYEGKVYCVTVPTGFIVVRRNGKPQISGNCEGEKDVHACELAGLVATTAPMGADSWRTYYWEWLQGASRVIVVADDDDAGHKHAAAVCADLRGHDIPVSTLLCAEGANDAFDHFGAGYGVSDFRSVNLNQLRPKGTSDGELMQAMFQPLRFAIDGLLPVGLTVFGAPPKMGKSFMTLDIALGVAYGGRALSTLQCNQGSVLYLSLDNDTLRRLQQRRNYIMGHEKIPAELPIEYHIAWPTGGHAIAACQEWVNETDDPLLIVVDTLIKVEPGLEGEERRNAYAATTETLSRWAELAARNDVCVLTVHHDRKASDGDWMNRFTGSRGITATAQTLWMLKADRGAKEGELLVSGRDIDGGDLELYRSGWSWICTTVPREHGLGDRMKSIIEWVGNMSRSGRDAMYHEIAEAFPEIEDNALRSYLSRAANSGRLVRVGKGVYRLGK